MSKSDGPVQQDTPPVSPPSQPVGFIVAQVQPAGNITYELRWTAAVVEPIQFCFLVIQVALNTAGVLYANKQSQSIMVPQIQLPPGAKLRHDD